MLLPNDLLDYAGSRPHTIRILWIDGGAALAYTYELDMADALPRVAALADLVADVRGGRARLLADDPWRVATNAADAATLPPKYLTLRDQAWAVVADLVRAAPALFDARSRGPLVAACAAAHGVSHPTVYRYLRRYWERGQHPDALLPDYANSGAPGKTRGTNANVKRGRPSKSGAVGLNADAAVRDIIRAAVLRHAAMHPVFSRRAAYRQMIEDYFHARPETAPTYGQFSYWIDRDGDPSQAG